MKRNGKEWATSVLKDISTEELLKQAFPDGAPSDFQDRSENGDPIVHDKLEEAFCLLSEAKLSLAKEDEDFHDYMEGINKKSRNHFEWEMLHDEFQSGVYEGVILSKENLIEKL